MHKLFVYGTLMGGDGVPAFARCLRLYEGPSWPYAVWSGEVRNVVHGEVLTVDDDALASLDKFEGVPRHYIRIKAPSSEGRVWVYVAANAELVAHQYPRNPSGRWSGWDWKKNSRKRN